MLNLKPKPLVPWYGGKARMAPIIAGKLPPHKIYVEPFGGAAGVLMAKTPSHIEVYNDLHDGIVTLFKVVRDPLLCRQLLELLELTPYARSEWKECNFSWANETDPVEKARKVYVTLAQNFVGVTKNGSWSFGGAKYDGNVANTFYRSLENIKKVGLRLHNVILENAPAINVIHQWEAAGQDVLYYLDPPYLPETRKRKPDEYLHEMTLEDHEALLNWCLSSENKIILSGYYSELYADSLETRGWVREDYRAISSAAMQSKNNGLKGKPASTANRVECLWFSPNAIITPTLWNLESEVI